MAGIPWDDWFYNLPYKRNEINSLHTKAVNTENKVQTDIIYLNEQLATFRQLVAGNQTLLYMKTFIVVDDLELAKFQTEIDALPPPPAGIVPLEFGQLIAETIGGGLVLKVLFHAGKEAIKRFFARGTQVTGETTTETLAGTMSEPLLEAGLTEGSIVALEGAAEGGGEAIAAASTGAVEAVGTQVTKQAAKTIIGNMTARSLAATGIGIFAAVGIDAIFGAIDGAQENHEIDEEIKKMSDALDKVDGFEEQVQSTTRDVKNQMVTQESTFINVVDDLAHIKTPTFSYKYTTGFDNLSKFVAAQNAAIAEYSLLIQLRNTYAQAVKRNPKVTKDAIINNVLFTAPASVTEKVLNDYWTVLAKYSDAMKNAK